MIIGITGALGAGKTKVTELLAKESEAYIINADKIGHRLLTDKDEIYQNLIREFGNDILDDNEEINRKKLGNIVFSDSDKLVRLNSIVHPTLTNILLQEVNDLRVKNKVVIVDAALIYEWNMEGIFDFVILVDAPAEIRKQRLERKGVMTEEYFEKVNALQIPSSLKARKADFIINNIVGLDELNSIIKGIWKKIYEENKNL